MSSKEELIGRVMRREIDISAAVMDNFIMGKPKGFVDACRRVVYAHNVYEKHLGEAVMKDESVTMDAKLEKLGTRELQSLINDLAKLA